MRYLGAQVSGSRIRIKDLKFIEERSFKQMDGWQGGSMSLAGRKVLIDSSSNGIYTYYMSLFRVPPTFSENLLNLQRRFSSREGILLGCII
jgi:hypothetical protein